MADSVLTKMKTTLAIIFMIAIFGCTPSKKEKQTGQDSTGKTNISIEVDFGGRADNFECEIDWQPGMTVLDATQYATTQEKIRELKIRGDGPMALLIGINGVENEGAAGDNWVFSVNGKVSNKGCGTYQLNAGDQVRWKMDKYP
jgi:hypothetical protein